MNRIRRVDLPDGLMPDDVLYENAKKIDDTYKEMYKHLSVVMAGEATTTEIIVLMAQYFTERLALLVGDNINDYDKSVLRGVLERHIAEIVFVE